MQSFGISLAIACSSVICIKAQPETIKTSPLLPEVTIFIVLFNPVPRSTYPNSFLLDNPLIALIIASQSFLIGYLVFFKDCGIVIPSSKNENS